MGVTSMNLVQPSPPKTGECRECHAATGKDMVLCHVCWQAQKDNGHVVCRACGKLMPEQDKAFDTCTPCFQKRTKEFNAEGSSYSTGGTVFVSCSHAPKVFMRSEDSRVQVAVGPKSEAVSGKWDLVVNCSDYEISTGNGYPDGWESLAALDSRVPPEVLEIGWRDFDPPPLTVEWWRELWNGILAHAEGLPSFRVLVCCMGGHGRSGTGAAALLMAVGVFPTAKEAIAYLRERVCQKMVESEEQEKYLENLLKGESKDDTRTVARGTERGKRKKRSRKDRRDGNPNPSGK